MRFVKRLLTTAVLLLILLPLLLSGWLVGSSNGLRWLLTYITPPQALEIDAIEGSLISGLRVKGIRYHDEKVKISLDEVLLEWRPAALLQQELRAEMLYLQHLRIELPPSDDTPLQLPDIRLPITVQLDDVQVSDLEIIKPEWPAIHINNASLRGTANRGGVMVQYLDISSDVAQLALHGTLHPYAGYWHKLEFQWQMQLAGHPALNGSGKLLGDLRRTTLQHTLTLPLRASSEVQLLELLQEPRWQAALQIPKQRLSAIYPHWPGEQVALTARGNGSLRQATVERFTLDALNSRAHGKGSLQWQDGFQWQADVESRRFDLPALWALLKLPAQQMSLPMIGVGVKTSLKGDLDQLSFSNTTLHAFDGAIRGKGQVQWRDTPEWRMQLQAKQLELAQLWPLLALEGYGLPPGRVDLTTGLRGDKQGIDFSQFTLQALGATLRGDVGLRWQPQLQWQASLAGEGLDPAVWQPQRFAAWPGKLATRLENRGSYANGVLLGELEIKELTGELRGYPVQLQTRLALRPQQQLEVDAFTLSSAESQVEAHGTIGEQLGLEWRLDSPQLAQLYPDISGALNLSGQLGGARSEPLLQLELDGKQLGYAGQQIGALRGNATVQLFSWQQLRGDLYSRDLQLAGQAIDTLELHVRGDAADHNVKLQLGMEKLEALWRLSGAFDSERQQWRGEIRVADMNNPELGLWQLQAPARLTASADELRLEPLCWHQQAAELCLNGERQMQQWQGELHGRELGLALLSPWLPHELELTGTAALHASARYQPHQPLSATARVEVGAGNVSYPLLENERSEWRFDAGQWQATLNEEGLRSQLHLALAGKDHINAALDLPGYDPLTTPLAAQPLKGELKAAFSDLGLLNTLFYEVQGVQGRVELNSQIGGSVEHPALTGRLQLHDGQLQIPRLGLFLSELEFDAQSAGSDQVNYHLSLRSGDGKISARGETRLDPREGWPTRISLSGENFEASHIPEARIIINPTLEMKMARREIWLEGEVEVPQARLQPKEFTTTASTSGDVVIVDAPAASSRPWQIHNRIRLILGKRVSLYGFGFEGNIGGNLLLIDEPGKITAASGELNVLAGGRYRAYGQRLDVEQGRLLFAGGPITNPALDLRAVRHIQEVTAGIKVYGPLRQPQFELFSVPAMDQTDALAYLVLGMPLEKTRTSNEGAAMAQAALALGLKGGDILARSIGDRFGLDEMRIESTGKGEQAALVMGRYLSPRLYIGYGVGLIDAVNTFNLRYQLSNRWQLKAESGINQSADMIYTIEK